MAFKAEPLIKAFYQDQTVLLCALTSISESSAIWIGHIHLVHENDDMRRSPVFKQNMFTGLWHGPSAAETTRILRPFGRRR